MCTYEVDAKHPVGAVREPPIGIKIRKKGDKGTHFVDADGVESSSIHEGASR
jgi:hypothetical protein